MTGLFLKSAAISTSAAAIVGLSVALAEGVSLPGGADSVNEVHGDWTVSCVIRTDAQDGKSKRCSLAQEQVRAQAQGHQRVLRMEVRPEGEGIKGSLILPFGLDLASGVTYQLDEGQPGSVQHYRTCVPVGCLVDIGFDATTVSALKYGNALRIMAMADGGQAMEFSISLTGFSSAYDRVVALLK